jgi:hypothetical protein
VCIIGSEQLAAQLECGGTSMRGLKGRAVWRELTWDCSNPQELPAAHYRLDQTSGSCWYLMMLATALQGWC